MQRVPTYGRPRLDYRTAGIYHTLLPQNDHQLALCKFQQRKGWRSRNQQLAATEPPAVMVVGSQAAELNAPGHVVPIGRRFAMWRKRFTRKRRVMEPATDDATAAGEGVQQWHRREKSGRCLQEF